MKLDPRKIAIAVGVVATGGLLAWCGCGRKNAAPPAALVASSSGSSSSSAPPATSNPPPAFPTDDEPESLANLANRLGAAGLVEAAESDPSRRHTTVLALAYADGFDGLPFLAEIAATGAEADARAAVDSASQIASRPRDARDMEDAQQLRAGCDRFLAVAKDAQRPRPVRVGAVRTLRMLEDAHPGGCAKPADVPNDVNAK